MPLRCRDPGPPSTLTPSSSSSSSYSSASTESKSEELSGDGEDGMAVSEAEAAVVLASFAELAAARNSDGGCSDPARRCRIETESAKASAGQVKIESAAVDSILNNEKPVPLSFDLNEELQGSAAEEEGEVNENRRGDEGVRLEKHKEKHEDEEDVVVELIATSGISPTLHCSSSSSSSKTRHNMKEDEKEARRLRRVIANRESARQTIRRRQALYEELTRKAADSALENQKLKREKGLALVEYRYLQSNNRNLKEQFADRLRCSYRGKSVLAGNTGVSTSSSSPYGRQFFPCGESSFPSIIPPSNATLSRPGAYSVVAPADSRIQHSYDQVPAESTCAVPRFAKSPWCFQGGGSSYLPSRNMEPSDRHSTESKDYMNGSWQTAGSQPTVFQSRMAAVSSGCSVEASSSTCLAYHLQELSPSTSCGRKLVDPAAAAEARKRRKELAKLKNLHCRASRIHCRHSFG